MPDAEGVVFAFASGWERSKTVFLFDRGQTIPSTREDFVRIGLMAHVPHDAIVRRVEDAMQRDREFHRAETRGKVSTPRRDGIDQIVAQFVAHGGDLRILERAQIRRALDA